MLWLLIACTGTPPTQSVPLRSSPLVSPWTAWDLPVGDGRVVYADRTVLSVRYEDGDGDDIAHTWRTALRAAGAVEQVDLTDGPLVSVQYALEAHRVALSVSPLDAATAVVVSLDGAAPPWKVPAR